MPATAAQVFGPVTVNPLLNATGVKTLLTMNTSLPPGGKNIVIAVLMPNAAFSEGASGRHTLRITKTTVLYETPIGMLINYGGQRTKPIMLMAIDDVPAGNDTYTFEINTTAAGSSTGLVHVQGMVIKADADAQWTYNTTAVSVSSGGTATVVTLSTNYPAGTKVVALAYVLGQPNTTTGGQYNVGAGNVKVKLNGTVVSSNQFNYGGSANVYPLHTNLCFGTTLSTSTQTWAVEFTNGSSVAFNVYAILVVFTVTDLAFLDTASVALSNGVQVTVGDLTTSLQGDVAVIAIASAENASTTSATAFNANDVVLQLNNSATGQISNLVSWLFGSTGGHDRSGNLPLFRFDTGVTNPSYQIKMTARANGINGEAKIVAFSTVTVEEKTVTDSISLLDAASVSRSFVVSDSFSLTEAYSSEGHIPVSDSLSLTDSIESPKTVLVTDSIYLTDAIGPNELKVSDSITFTEAVGIEANIPAADSLSFTEFAAGGEATKEFFDSISLTDIVFIERNVQRIGARRRVLAPKRILPAERSTSAR